MYVKLLNVATFVLEESLVSTASATAFDMAATFMMIADYFGFLR